MECNFENCPNFERLGKKFADRISELEAKNEKLKHSNENLRLALKTYEMPEVVKVLTDWRTGELDLRINKYKQTLQEIKTIAEEDVHIVGDEKLYYDSIEKILQVITKAEEE